MMKTPLVIFIMVIGSGLLGLGRGYWVWVEVIGFGSEVIGFGSGLFARCSCHE